LSLRHTLLALLDWVPLHGYALREAAKGYSWLHPMTNANIYPALRQLEENGFIEHRQEVVEGRLRKVYSTTIEGKAELARWLGDSSDQSGVYRDPKLLKICLLRDGTLVDARKWIQEDVDLVQKGIAETEALLRASADRIPKYTLRVARHGLDLARLRSRFLHEVLDALDEDLAAQPARRVVPGSRPRGSPSSR
jgi:DNA-binding PadR family transcriptional regulator